MRKNLPEVKIEVERLAKQLAKQFGITYYDTLRQFDEALCDLNDEVPIEIRSDSIEDEKAYLQIEYRKTPRHKEYRKNDKNFFINYFNCIVTDDGQVLFSAFNFDDAFVAHDEDYEKHFYLPSNSYVSVSYMKRGNKEIFYTDDGKSFSRHIEDKIRTLHSETRPIRIKEWKEEAEEHKVLQESNYSKDAWNRFKMDINAIWNKYVSELCKYKGFIRDKKMCFHCLTRINNLPENEETFHCKCGMESFVGKNNFKEVTR